MKSQTNSVTRSKYVFQPIRYDDNDNLICKLVRRSKCKVKNKIVNRDKCKLTGIYDFNKGEFIIKWTAEGFLTKSHKRLLDYFLREYDWID